MKGQVPVEIGAIITGAFLLWIGVAFLGIPATSSLTGSLVCMSVVDLF